MKFVFILGLSLMVVATAEAERGRVKCPVVANELDGTYSKASARYRCYSKAKQAQNAGYVRDDTGELSITPTPTPTSIAQPTPIPTGTPTPITFTGTSDKSTAIFSVGGPSTCTYSYVGENNFAITLRHSDGSYGDLLANEIGSISGSAGINSAGSYYLEVVGVGSWSITITRK